MSIEILTNTLKKVIHFEIKWMLFMAINPGIIWIISCQEPVLTLTLEPPIPEKIEILNHQRTKDTNVYTMERIRKMIHLRVLNAFDAGFSFNAKANNYTYVDFDYTQIFSADDPIDLLLMLGYLGDLQHHINFDNLGPIAQKHYNYILGLPDEDDSHSGIYYEPRIGKSKKDLRWYYNLSGPGGDHYFVPYYMVHMDSREEGYVRNAMKIIERQTRVRFVKDTDNYTTQTPIPGVGHVRIILNGNKRLRIEEKGGDFVGQATYARASDQSYVYLNPDSGYSQHVIIHELLHAITIAHEHQRVGRHFYFRNLPDTIGKESSVTPLLNRADNLFGDYYYFGDFDYASIMNYATGSGDDFRNMQYEMTRPDVHIKQPRFWYNLNEGLPIGHGATEINALQDYSNTNAPNPNINHTLNRTHLKTLLDKMDRNRLCYGRDILWNNATNFRRYETICSAYGPPSLGTTTNVPLEGEDHNTLWRLVGVYGNGIPGSIGNRPCDPPPDAPYTYYSLYTLTWELLGRQIETNVVEPVSYVPADFFEANEFYSDDEKVAFMYSIHCSDTNTNTHWAIEDNLTIMREEIRKINSNVSAANGVHQKNYQAIYNYILSRIEGSSRFDTNYRLEYFWTAPIRGGKPTILMHFLSDGDINTIRHVARY